MRRSFLTAGITICILGSSHAVVVQLSSAKDNTLYENAAGGASNGAGPVFFAGTTGMGVKNRGLLGFDLSSIPSSATINSATLTLSVTKAGFGGADAFSLHRVLQNWGEGSSNSTQGSGAPSTAGDATWVHTFYNTSIWNTTGGDFASIASAATSMGAIGFYGFSSPQLAADVQSWIVAPATNFGWLLKNSESIVGSSLQLASREASVSSSRPMLMIDYTVVPSSSSWLGDISGDWSDPSKWSDGVPDASGAHAVLGPVISTGQSVQLVGTRTVGTLTINSAQPYTISGTGTLNFDDSSSDVFLNVLQGSHGIESSLTTAAGKTIRKTGAGTIQIKPPTIDALSIEGGTVSFDNTNSTASIKTLTLSGGKLDLRNNTLQLDDGAASPINAVRSALQFGSLLSTTASLPHSALAYRAISATRVDIAAALAGDSDLDGKVNTLDFNVLAGNFGGSNQFWIDGDFNYNAEVDSTDFGILVANFGNSAPLLGLTVPEPTTGVAALAAVFSILRRTRKSA